MVLFFLLVAVSGLVNFFLFTSGIRQGGYQTALGITKQTWIGLHNWSGLIFVVIVIIHLVLHLKWLVCMTKLSFEKKKKR